MVINKIQKYAESKNISVPKLAKMLGRDKQVFYQIFERNDCRVSDLEKMSKALGVPPTYWWKDEVENVVNDPKQDYGLIAQIELLKYQLKDKERLIARLEKEIDRLEAKNHKTGDNDLVYAGTCEQNNYARMQH